MKYKKWNQAAPDRSAVLALMAAGLPALAATVLCARGVDTPEAAAAFLAAADAPLHDPMLLRDMDRAVERMERALAGNEYIAVYGDYDVDGITSTCLLTRFLSSRGARVIPYIPDRLEEGYGLNREAVELLADKGVTLIVTVDCGITAVEEARYAASLGLDVIITDHHECKDELPQAVAVVDPHRRDCGYPFPCLAGVGVALKLALALTPGSERERVLSEYADLAAIGTVADVMQLSGENRAIVRRGLQALARTRRPGLRALIREAGAEGKSLTASCIGFTLAPRINAAGRMGCAPVAAELLLTEDPGRAEALSHALCALNRERQSIEGRIYEECLARLERESAGQRRSIVLAGEGWHQGVVGIVASRLAEKYACPTFMICVQDGRGKGSCRSFGGFNLFRALESCADLLEGFGGHELAAGFPHRGGGGRTGPPGALWGREPQAGVLPQRLYRLLPRRGGRRAASEVAPEPGRPSAGRHFLFRGRRGDGRCPRRPDRRHVYPPDQRIPGEPERTAPTVRPAPRAHPDGGGAGPL